MLNMINPSVCNRENPFHQDLPLTAGVQEQFGALYETHRDAVCRFLVGRGVNFFEAQDVTQDVFVDLIVSLQKGKDVTSPQGWLYAVAGRAAIDYWRRECRTIQIPLDVEQGQATDLPSAEPTPEVTAQRRQRLRRLVAGIGALPTEQRLCVQLRMQGLRYREIGDVMGVATSTVADWLMAAIRTLRGACQ